MRSMLALRSGEQDSHSGLFDDVPPAPPPRSFRERGFSFIPLRSAHLEFMKFVYGREVPKLEECVGRAMVDANYLPLGVVLVHFEDGGRSMLMAHFGKWMKVFPKDILRGMSELCRSLRESEIFILHASADEHVPGSDYLLEWLGARLTGERDNEGPLYRLDLRECKI